LVVLVVFGAVVVGDFVVVVVLGTVVVAAAVVAVAGTVRTGAEAVVGTTGFRTIVVTVEDVVGATLDDASCTTWAGAKALQGGFDQSMTPWSPYAAGRGLPVTSTTSPIRLKL
jgi:hypothetical protein